VLGIIKLFEKPPGYPTKYPTHLYKSVKESGEGLDRLVHKLINHQPSN